MSIRGSSSPGNPNATNAADNKMLTSRPTVQSRDLQLPSGGGNFGGGDLIVLHYAARHVLIENTRLWNACEAIALGRHELAVQDVIVRRVLVFAMATTQDPACARDTNTSSALRIGRATRVDAYHNTFDMPADSPRAAISVGSGLSPASGATGPFLADIDFWNNVVRSRWWSNLALRVGAGTGTQWTSGFSSNTNVYRRVGAAAPAPAFILSLSPTYHFERSPSPHCAPPPARTSPASKRTPGSCRTRPPATTTPCPGPQHETAPRLSLATRCRSALVKPPTAPTAASVRAADLATVPVPAHGCRAGDGVGVQDPPVRGASHRHRAGVGPGWVLANHTGGDGVDPDPERPELGGPVAGEHVERALAGGVADHESASRTRYPGADVEAAALRTIYVMAEFISTMITKSFRIIAEQRLWMRREDASCTTRKGAYRYIEERLIVRLTVEGRLDHTLICVLYPIYLSACGPLRTQAAARHVLSFEEFAADMHDDRIEKHVVWDEDIPVGLATLTKSLAAISWVSAEYYGSRYPDVAARGALYYLGYILVDRSRRRSNALILMTDVINRRVAASEGVLGFDVCQYNDAHGIGRHAKRLLSGSSRIDPIDTQSYYAADYRPS